ncbi:hypothetical protein [Lysinibacillus irui]|uniref:Uncharacterized protein n=1 Tax=Lysinibacillus irui TaxID=2998077 RepID=A0AAJ5UTN0_9BACI|nr:hypothetical protein [Lysinibacillus irui]WDV07138.1 hypothetical protein OU989_01280 [Lysinibacillus irui]
MKFYHCTKSKNARKILKLKDPKKITPSLFTYIDCLNDWLGKLLNPNFSEISSEDFVFPRFYYSQGENRTVFWLGTGLYCFAEENKDESPNYAKRNNLDVILDINYSDEYTEFEMHKNKDLLTKFLEDDVVGYFKVRGFSGEKLEALELVVQYLILEIEDEYFKNPHCAAVIIEMFIHILNLNFDVVSNKYLKNDVNFTYDNYSSIRNLDFISGFEYNYDLSHKIKE